MRVLHLLSSTGYHGAENMVAQLVKALNSLGVRNSVGIFYGNGNSNKDVLPVVRDCIEDGVIFPCHKKLDISTIWTLRRYIQDNSIEIVHSHKYKTNLYSAVAAMGSRSKLVSTCHNWLGTSRKMRFYAALDKRVLKAFDAVIGVSTEVEAELLKHIPEGKIRRIENGIDLERFFISKRQKEDAKRELGLTSKKVIGYVGRLSEEKGLLFLIEAFRTLISKNEDISCLIVGDGEYAKQLKNAARAMGLSDSVMFTGRRKDTPLLYSAMDVFVLPSMKEAFPMVLLEAMACGVPIVATRVGDIPRILDHGVSGLLVQKGNAEELKQAIELIISDGEGTRKMAKEARKVVQENFSSHIMAKRYREVYEEIQKHR